MRTKLPNIFDAYNHIRTVINSCASNIHLDSCRRTLSNFRKMYSGSKYLRILAINLNIELNSKLYKLTNNYKNEV
jgi:hypothetical protein